MCGQLVALPIEVVKEVIRDIERNLAASAMPDYPAAKESVFPGAAVAIIVPDKGYLRADTMRWGYEASWAANKMVFNTRFDTATKPEKNMWTESLERRRCIVPTFGFYEPHHSETFINPRSGKPNKQSYHFASPEHPVTFIAGIYENGHFSLMTTEPNAVMQPIHKRMPVVLDPSELTTWLYGDYVSLAERHSIELCAARV